jgi:hypothetical protein
MYFAPPCPCVPSLISCAVADWKHFFVSRDYLFCISCYVEASKATSFFFSSVLRVVVGTENAGDTPTRGLSTIHVFFQPW